MILITSKRSGASFCVLSFLYRATLC